MEPRRRGGRAGDAARPARNCSTRWRRRCPELLGSADLTGSNLTDWALHDAQAAAGQGAGKPVHYGVREFGMAAIDERRGAARRPSPYGGTFLTFSDYSRNALRMSALMKLPVVHVFTHDSIGPGRKTARRTSRWSMCRACAWCRAWTWAPADATETAVAWRESLRRADGPSALALSRQDLPHAARRGRSATNHRARRLRAAPAEGESSWC